MKFRFKTQQYQVDAVSAVVDVFKGQPLIGFEEYTRDLGVSNKPKIRKISMFDSDENTASLLDDNDDIGYSNASIKLSDERLLDNIREIQSKSNLQESSHLINPLGTVSLDVEMETGTGKTYVYTRTFFELNKRYGWSKFIVVVPSIAIQIGRAHV